jgi:hypothetical protein
MDHKDFFLKHWNKEAAATRKVISRIPEHGSDYRADPKARTAREIAWLVVRRKPPSLTVWRKALSSGARFPRPQR